MRVRCYTIRCIAVDRLHACIFNLNVGVILYYSSLGNTLSLKPVWLKLCDLWQVNRRNWLINYGRPDDDFYRIAPMGYHDDGCNVAAVQRRRSSWRQTFAETTRHVRGMHNSALCLWGIVHGCGRKLGGNAVPWEFRISSLRYRLLWPSDRPLQQWPPGHRSHLWAVLPPSFCTFWRIQFTWNHSPASGWRAWHGHTRSVTAWLFYIQMLQEDEWCGIPHLSDLFTVNQSVSLYLSNFLVELCLVIH